MPRLLVIPALFLTLIHRSAWEGNSANFALTKFSEVRLILQRHFALASSAASILGTLQRSLIIFATH
jgi:hypothetical protein